MLRPTLLGFAYVLGIAGCVVGDTTPWAPETDASVGEADADLGSPDSALQQACEPAAVTLPNGNHNEGQACLTCHGLGNGNGAPVFTLAGTLYNSAAGTAPLAAGTIVVTDANGLSFKLATATNGNFYSSATIAWPVTVKASKCPDELQMGSQPAVGDCNGCHTGIAAQGRIHLP
jgi:hypothetical protein